MADLLIKAVMPASEQGWLSEAKEMVAGYVVRAADIAWATTPSDFYQALGLGWPGCPVPPDPTHLDVLTFEPNGALTLKNAVGGPTAEVAAAMGGPCVEPPPFTGNGFVRHERPIPLWWLAPARIPAGAQLWRVFANGARSLLATYPHVGLGWIAEPGLQVARTDWTPPSLTLGLFAHVGESRVLADRLPDGRVVLASPVQQAGFQPSPRGLWWTTLDPQEVPTLHGYAIRARWRGLPFSVTQQVWPAQGPARAVLVYTGHDSFVAAAAGLTRIDQGVDMITVPVSELTNVEGLVSEPPPPSNPPAEPRNQGESPLEALAVVVLTNEARRLLQEATEHLAQAGPEAFAERYPDLENPFDDDGPTPISLLTRVAQHPYPRTIGWCDWAGEDDPGQVRSFVETACRNLGLTPPAWDPGTEQRVLAGLGDDARRGDYPPALLRDVDAQLRAVGLGLLLIDDNSDTYLYAPVTIEALTQLDGVRGAGFTLRSAER